MPKPGSFIGSVMAWGMAILLTLYKTFWLVGNGITRLILLGIMYNRTLSIDKFYPQSGVKVELATETYRTLIGIWFALTFLDWVPFDYYVMSAVSRRSRGHFMMVFLILLALTAMISGSLLHKSVSRASDNWTGYNYEPTGYGPFSYDTTQLISFGYYFRYYTPLLILQCFQVAHIVGFYIVLFWLPTSFRLPKEYRPLLHSSEAPRHSSSTEDVPEGPIKMFWTQQEQQRGKQYSTVPVEADSPRPEKQIAHLVRNQADRNATNL
jgi:hypothetical protein